MATIWHPVPGRLQSVSVADKDNIWGVTLDLQLCKFNSKTQQWQLVSVTSEPINQARFSSSSAQSLRSAVSNSSFSAAKRFSSYLPSLGGLTSSTPSTPITGVIPTMSPTTTTAAAAQQKNSGTRSTPGTPALTRDNSSTSLLVADTEEDTTVQVSAASDGTVVRLDRSLKAWYLIAPHNDHVDYEKDVIWIDLGHFWKCVSVASISQIWGLSDCGDIYYGTSDRFALLEHAITSGAGYNKPNFTHISVGHDNVVLATDAHSGTVFRLKLHPTGACPPVWNALPGTGPGSRLHIVNCSLSTGEFIVGVAKDGRVYRYSRSVWTPLGGGAKLDNVGVGIDGYVLGVDRDGDLFGCQLESTAIVVPPLDRPSSREWTHKAVKDDEPLTPGSPQAPNGPSLFNTPRPQGMSKRPTSSPRELFEMAASISTARNNRFPAGDLRVDTRTPSPLRESGGAGGTAGPGGSSWAAASPRTYSKAAPRLDRTDSQMSKRSYASDITIPKTPTGLNLSQPTTPVSPQVPDSDLSSFSAKQAPVQEAAAVVPALTPSSHARASPLRIQTRGMSSSNPAPLSTDQGGESYFTSKPITTFGPSSNLSPLTSFPLNGNPYAGGSKPSSDNSAVQTPITPHSDSSNNFNLSASSKSSSGSSSGSSSNNNLLTIPGGQQNANPQKDTAEAEESHSSTVDGATPPSSSPSISPSVSPSDRIPCAAAIGFVPEAQGHQRQPILEEGEGRLEQHFQQPDEGAYVESVHGSVSLPNANGPPAAIETVEMAMVGINEHRDIHSIFDLPHGPPPSTSSATAVGTAAEIDFRQPSQSPLPPPQKSQPAVFNAVVPSSPQQQRMELNRLLSSSDKSEWIENGTQAVGGLGQTGENNYNNDDEMNDGVNIAGQEGQRNNDDGLVWCGDTAVVQPNLDQDKRDPSMAFSHLEQPTPSVLSTITRIPAARTGSFPSQSSRTVPPFSSVPQEYYQSTPPFSSNSNSYYNDTNSYFNDINNSGQTRTASFFSWDIKQELNEPSSSSAAPLSVFHQQQQEENLYLEPPYPRQDLLNQHRPSDSSEVLMLQQQEFLRLTRLRSQRSSAVSANDPALSALSEKTEVLQDHPLSDKTEIDFNNNSDNFINDSNYQFQQQQFQQQQKYHQQYQEFAPPSRQSQEYYDNNYTSQHPDNNETMLRIKLWEKMTPTPAEEKAAKRLSMFIPPDSLPPEFDEILRNRESAKPSRASHAIANANAANANANRVSNKIPNASAGSSGRNSRSSSSRGNPNININADVNNAIADISDHPSYSSTHLQNYVNTTMSHPHLHPQSGRSSVQSINLTPANVNPTNLTNPTNSMAGVYNFNTGPGSGSGSGAGRSPYGHGNAHGISSGNNNRTTTTVGSGLAPGASSGGITGEDAQGRWVGSPTGADNRVSTYGTSDILKSRCCIIQ